MARLRTLTPFFALLGLCSLAGLPLSALEPAKIYERDVFVPAAGWVRVPLDLAALRHLAADGRELRVIGPDGSEIPRRLENPSERVVERPVRVLDVRPAEPGWQLIFDTGEGAPSHERLILDLERRISPPTVRLEGSADRRAWQPLAEGDLVRLDESEAGPERDGISYPATELRYLRLSWPRVSGLPALQGSAVEASPGPSISLATGDSNCASGEAGSLQCRLELPVAGIAVRRIELTLTSQGAIPAGYVLEAPEGARWRPLAEGVWQRRAAETKHLLNLESQAATAAADFLRLSLFGAGMPPELAGVRLELAAREVVFRAPAPGRFTISYGAGLGAPPREEKEAAPEAVLLEAGPESERPAPPLPASASAGAAITIEAFGSSWQVIAPGAAAGDVVRLEIPDEAYAASRAGLADLRLAALGRQIPYVRWSSPEPARVVAASGLRAEPERRKGWSRIELDLPKGRLPWTLLEIAAPGGPLRRKVEALAVRPRNPDPAAREIRVASMLWDCAPTPPLPCRALVPLVGPGAPRLALRFEDGDDAPLGEIDVSIWRRRDALVFVWPSGGNVRLLAGAENLGAPQYDLAALESELLARPWHPAQVAASLQEEPSATRFLLPAVLGLAGIALLLLLRRILTAA
ncbi:MAG TPA: DUF3999 family protein [Thermoanaerobaculia bacterium]|nr:DUF3999 family protein [Thermoanaerobaculia bacterium]